MRPNLVKWAEIFDSKSGIASLTWWKEEAGPDEPADAEYVELLNQHWSGGDSDGDEEADEWWLISVA